MSSLCRIGAAFAVSVPLMILPLVSSARPDEGSVAARVAQERFTWTRAQSWGRGAWQESWTPDHIPLAITPVVGPEGRLWMVGGLGVWSSADGLRWDRASDRRSWGERYGATTVFFRNELWALGGEENRVKRRDVFHSPDGAGWTRAPAPPWSPRRWHTATVFRDRVWVIGGSDSASRNDVWETADGASWRLVTANAPWEARGGHATVVWRDRLCIVGGTDGSRVMTDVWCSPDGRAWSRLTSAGWTPRIYPGVLVFRDRLWVFGGSADRVSGDSTWLNDVRVSDDGSRWLEHSRHAPWSRRAAQYAVVFGDRIWIFGGKGIEATGRGGFADDVWTLGAGATEHK